MIQRENQIKYGYIKEVDFTTDQQNHGYQTMILLCIQHIIKKNLLLLEDLVKP